MKTTLSTLCAAVAVALCAAGCGGDSDESVAIVGDDASVDAASETGSDAVADLGQDSAADASGADVGSDVAADAGQDAQEVSVGDGGGDADAQVDCLKSFADQMSPVIADLLYPSESDYPFEVVSFDDAGSGEISTAQLLSLLGLAADTVVEQRAFDDFFRDYLLNGDDGAKYEAMRQIFQDGLTDLTFVRVGEIEIHIYLVGRSSCSQILGLTTVSIET